MQVFKGEDYKDVIGATSDDYGKYFSNTSPFYDEKWSPFNLGIYMDRQDDKPKASKYIGVMPALDRMLIKRKCSAKNCLLSKLSQDFMQIYH